MDEGNRQTLRRMEIEHILAGLPNPVLKIVARSDVGLLDSNFDKNETEIGGSSIGGCMLYLSGSPRVIRDQDNKMVGDVFAAGGFMGDGIAAYGLVTWNIWRLCAAHILLW